VSFAGVPASAPLSALSRRGSSRSIDAGRPFLVEAHGAVVLHPHLLGHVAGERLERSPGPRSQAQHVIERATPLEARHPCLPHAVRAPQLARPLLGGPGPRPAGRASAGGGSIYVSISVIGEAQRQTRAP